MRDVNGAADETISWKYVPFREIRAFGSFVGFEF
jgi:hypothetical protein